MKKGMLLSAIVCVTLVMLIIACSKTGQQQKQREQVLKPETGKILPITTNVTSELYDPGGGGSCGCSGYGGVFATNIVHYLATCRSDCTTGLGFRCGYAGFYICNDGYVVACPMGHCPISYVLNNRVMTSEITFYSNNTVRLRFQHSVPSEEAGNTVFEVEDNSLIEIPEGILIGGVGYQSFTAIRGNYFIDYTDGPYGSVVFNISLQQ